VVKRRLGRGQPRDSSPGFWEACCTCEEACPTPLGRTPMWWHLACCLLWRYAYILALPFCFQGSRERETAHHITSHITARALLAWSSEDVLRQGWVVEGVENGPPAMQEGAGKGQEGPRASSAEAKLSCATTEPSGGSVASNRNAASKICRGPCCHARPKAPERDLGPAEALSCTRARRPRGDRCSLHFVEAPAPALHISLGRLILRHRLYSKALTERKHVILYYRVKAPSQLGH